jgi:phage-related holin
MSRLNKKMLLEQFSQFSQLFTIVTVLKMIVLDNVFDRNEFFNTVIFCTVIIVLFYFLNDRKEIFDNPKSE